MFQENKCLLCGYDNPDILEDHLVAFSGEYGYSEPSISLHLCVNCHRAIHRCSWTLVSEGSEAVIAKYLSHLETILPPSFFHVLHAELLSANENVIRQYQRLNNYVLATRSLGKKCSLCDCSNPDLLEEHDLNAWSQHPQSTTENMGVCANCHRILVKFYEKKTSPTSEQSKALLQKYLSQVRQLISGQTRSELNNFLKS